MINKECGAKVPHSLFIYTPLKITIFNNYQPLIINDILCQTPNSNPLLRQK